MPKFSNATDALDWAEKILSIAEGGRSNMTILEGFGNGNGKNYAILDAIEIRHCAKQSCINGWPCPYLRDSCLYHKLIPDPCIEYPPMSWAQEQRIMACEGRFIELLRKKKFIE